MKSEFLKELGLTQEQIDKVMDEHGEDIESLKSSHKAEMKTANSTIKGLRAEVSKFTGEDIEGLRNKVNELQTKYDTDIAAERTKYDNAIKENNLKAALKSVGAIDPDYIIFKHGGVEKFAYSEKKEPIGLEDIVKPYKESSPGLFESGESDQSKETSRGVIINTGATNSNGATGEGNVNAIFNAMIRGAAGKE